MEKEKQLIASDFACIIESRTYLTEELIPHIKNSKATFTFDFGVLNDLARKGLNCEYLDKSFSREKGEKQNQLVCEFLKTWYCDKENKDLFCWKNIEFGPALKIFIWSELILYVRLRLALTEIIRRDINHILLYAENELLKRAIKDSGLSFEESWVINLNLQPKKKSIYCFDIDSYMQKSMFRNNAKELIKSVLGKIATLVNKCFDNLTVTGRSKITIFAQPYHPTIPVIKRLSKNKKIRIITPQFFPYEGLQKFFGQRIWEIPKRVRDYRDESEKILRRFHENRASRLILADNSDITNDVYREIEAMVAKQVPIALSGIDSILDKINSCKIDAELMISNLGLFQTLVDCVLKRENVPRFLIINGLLLSDNCDEGKDATIINSYSTSIKKHYFKNDHRVVCLGDPRMDRYCIEPSQKNKKNKEFTTVVIGAAGYNNIDVNSYLSVEFDFIFEVMHAIKALYPDPSSCKIIVKLRPNNFKNQYVRFLEEYFDDYDVELTQTKDIFSILEGADVYVSTYSQTLLEAAAVGIPVIFFKNDREYLHPPFDLKSEINSAIDSNSLINLLEGIKAGSTELYGFNKREIIEKYVGPLDGKNTERCIEQLFNLVCLKV